MLNTTRSTAHVSCCCCCRCRRRRRFFSSFSLVHSFLVRKFSIFAPRGINVDCSVFLAFVLFDRWNAVDAYIQTYTSAARCSYMCVSVWRLFMVFDRQVVHIVSVSLSMSFVHLFIFIFPMIASAHCTHDVCTVRHVCYTLPNETKNRSKRKKSVAAQYIGCAVVHKNIYIYCWAAGPMRNEGTAQQQRRNEKNWNENLWQEM